MFDSLRLNLFNYVLVLFCAKFAYNLAISNLVFRWESCKGSVWESVKKCSSLCKVARTLRLGLAGGSWLEFATQSSRESKPPASSVLKNLTLRIPFSLQYKYPLYPRNVESFQREYWERNPREKQNWFIYNLHIETLQIPLFFSLLHPWKVHYQNLFSPYPHLWKCHLVLGKQLGRDQFHIGWCYGL